MLQEKLDEVLELHEKWLKQEDGGVCADLSNMDLCWVNLEHANLQKANLQGANLHEAKLKRANLQMANLFWAYLTVTDLHGANLQGAYLQAAKLSGSDLSGANLTRANLFGAYLDNTNMTGANLLGANLDDAQMTGANLSEVTLIDATINWRSHWLISELLFRAADNDSKRDAANIVRNNTNLCWKDFLAMDHPEQEWALNVLRAHIKSNHFRYPLTAPLRLLIELHNK